MKELKALKLKYCSWCEARHCKHVNSKCHRYSRRLLNKRMRQKAKKENYNE